MRAFVRSCGRRPHAPCRFEDGRALARYPGLHSNRGVRRLFVGLLLVACAPNAIGSPPPNTNATQSAITSTPPTETVASTLTPTAVPPSAVPTSPAAGDPSRYG